MGCYVKKSHPTVTTRAVTSCEAAIKLVATADPTILTVLLGPASVLPATCKGDFRAITCTGECGHSGTLGCSKPGCPGTGKGGLATPLELDPPAFKLDMTGESPATMNRSSHFRSISLATFHMGCA